MNRWLLNTFPTWALAVFLVGGFALLAWGASRFVRRRLPSVAEGEHNDLAGVFIGVLIGVYGIVLAFVIVALYEDFKEAESVVRTEATELAQLYRDSNVFPPAVRAELRTEITTYVRTVVDEEWALMEDGKHSEEAWRDIDHLYGIYHRYEPEGASATAFYEESIGKLNELVASRRERIEAAEQSMPTEFEILIVGGALLLVGFLALFGSRDPRVQTLMIVAVAGLVGFNLLIALVLDHPFSGDVTISNHVFREGALAELFAAEP